MQTYDGMNQLSRETLIKLVWFAMGIARRSHCEIHERSAEEVIRGFFADRRPEGVMLSVEQRYPGPLPPAKKKGGRH
jgi:hypothetical protein